MNTTFTTEQVAEAKSRIFNELAHAVQSNNNEDWFGLVMRTEEALRIAKQLRQGALDAHGVEA